eukprot:TRINITY_DN14722_c1_g1_i2.p1 TRINITY_DN14722_c1_g1~~TRINITY_DN14722_c1_g1_i2.p1  ORF type:complete len:257 (-),score=42.09 TRINITY_DN14722_c1_g1_i2:107-877(-)
MSMQSSPDRLVSQFLGLSSIDVPLQLGVDVLWPLVGIVGYATMVRILQSDLSRRGKPRGVPVQAVQVYNVGIIAASACILVGTLYFRILGATSWQKAYCPSGERVVSEGLRLCLWAYHVSKYAEYADTLFLLLKGKGVETLHYWHHLVVTFTSWTWMRSEVEWVADGVIFNTFVHCIMYYYYYLAANGTPPRWKKYLTGLQITQFMSSFVATAFWFNFHVKVGCGFQRVISISVMFNAWLLCMFIAFYKSSYSKRK